LNSEPPLVTKIRESVNYFILFSGLRGPSPWGHSIRRSTAASPPLLRFAARVQLPRRKGPGTHWAPSAALLSTTATCSACLSTLSPSPNVPQKISTLRPKKLPLPVRCRRYSLIVFSVCAAGGSLTLLGTIRLFCDAKIIQRAELVSKLRPNCLKTSLVGLFFCQTLYFRRELVTRS